MCKEVATESKSECPSGEEIIPSGVYKVNSPDHDFSQCCQGICDKNKPSSCRGEKKAKCVWVQEFSGGVCSPKEDTCDIFFKNATLNFIDGKDWEYAPWKSKKDIVPFVSSERKWEKSQTYKSQKYKYVIGPEDRNGGSKPDWTDADSVHVAFEKGTNKTIYISMHDSDRDGYDFLTQGHLKLTDKDLRSNQEEKIIKLDEPNEEYILQNGGNITIEITCHKPTE
jgi:hypothetical protein